MSRPIVILISMFLLLLVSKGLAAKPSSDTVLAEVAWPEFFDGEWLIQHREYRDNEWQEQKTLYRSDKQLIGPSVATYQNGRKVLVWSEQRPRKILLKVLEFNEEGHALGKADVLSDYGLESLGASVLIDNRDVAWVFFSTHRGDNDDIFYVRGRNGEWGVTQRLNRKNEVPDYSPVANFDEDGNIRVEWKSYSVLLDGYDIASSTVVLDGEAKSKLESNDVGHEEVNKNDIAYPAFLTQKGSYKVSFPNNKRDKSALITVN